MMEVDNSIPVQGGYDLEIFGENDIEKYKCYFCRKVMKDAIQLPYLDTPLRTCLTCYTAKIRDGICPISGLHNVTYYRDKSADREIGELNVFCRNKANGCPWSDKLKFLEEHLPSCEYKASYCNHCKQFIALHEHKNYCPEMQVSCVQCAKAVIRKNVENHQKFCQMRVAQCECGEKFFSKDAQIKLQNHWKHQRKCLYSYIGCEIDRGHKDENHDVLLVSNIVELTQNMITLWQNSEEKDIKIQQLENEVKEIKKNFREQTDRRSFNLKDLSKIVESSQREKEKLKDQPSQPQIANLGCGARVKKDINEAKSKIRDIENKNVEFQKSVTDMDLKIHRVESKTMNGEFIWKIDQIKFRMAQAKLDTVPVLHSAPCYTKQYEYKYCISLYLYGDGMGRGTHISIFFVVMKSKFDEILSWPMKTRVTFELINLKNEKESVIETIVSSNETPSFQKPTMDMNVPTGYPTFISIDRFLNEGFIKDNCAFIKTTVKTI